MEPEHYRVGERVCSMMNKNHRGTVVRVNPDRVRIEADNGNTWDLQLKNAVRLWRPTARRENGR